MPNDHSNYTGTLMIVSIDMDGTIANKNYVALLKKEIILKFGEETGLLDFSPIDPSTKNIIIEGNKPLLNHIINHISDCIEGSKQQSSFKVILANGSRRQNAYLDVTNSLTSNTAIRNKTHSVFYALEEEILPHLKEQLQKKFPDMDIDIELDKRLLPDLKSGKQPGDTWMEIRDKYNKNKQIDFYGTPKEEELGDKKSKSLLVVTQTHAIAEKYPNAKELQYTIYDDQPKLFELIGESDLPVRTKFTVYSVDPENGAPIEQLVKKLQLGNGPVMTQSEICSKYKITREEAVAQQRAQGSSLEKLTQTMDQVAKDRERRAKELEINVTIVPSSTEFCARYKIFEASAERQEETALEYGGIEKTKFLQ